MPLRELQRIQVRRNNTRTGRKRTQHDLTNTHRRTILGNYAGRVRTADIRISVDVKSPHYIGAALVRYCDSVRKGIGRCCRALLWRSERIMMQILFWRALLTLISVMFHGGGVCIRIIWISYSLFGYIA